MGLILEPNNKYYFVYLNDDEQPEMESCTYFYHYDVKKFTDLLSSEERKFLIAECAINDLALLNKMVEAGLVSIKDNFPDKVRSMSDEEVMKIIYAIKYSLSFNAYLRYMVSDEWEIDNFDSHEERERFVF